MKHRAVFLRQLSFLY